MNREQFKGKWNQFMGEAKRRWGKLTDDDWKVAEGDADKLAGRIQERYGDAKDDARREIDRIFDRLEKP